MNALPLVVYHTALTTALRFPSRPISSSLAAHLARSHGPRAQASLHFCSECNNLLYPKADPHRRHMVYACRICPYDEEAENKCVYRNDLLTVTKCVPAPPRPAACADVPAAESRSALRTMLPPT
jgi:hypothetical protein